MSKRLSKQWIAENIGPFDPPQAGFLRYRRYQDCPDAAKLHSEMPDDMDWETGTSPTRIQQRCPTCGFWVVWALP